MRGNGRILPGRNLVIRRTLPIKRTVVLTAVPLLLLLFSTGAAAFASQSSEHSSPASGAEAITITSTLATSSNGDTILYQLATQTFTGTFTGSAVGEDIVVIHPDGTFNVKVTETFTGTVLGSTSGTATIQRACEGTSGTTFSCEFTARHGTGGLAGVRAEVTSADAITGQDTIAGTYTGVVSFTSSDEDDDGTSSSARATMRSLASVSSDDSGDQASGTDTVTITSQTIPVVDANGNAIIYFLFADAFTGTISGNAIGEGVVVIHSGTFNVEATATFTGKILERTGTATFHVSSSGTSTSQTGKIELNHGTGELKGVEVEASSMVTATGPVTFSGTYNGDVQFDD